ncbi:MAG: hypothetical protein LBR21_01985 [Propionibacteriaceae bacterium]|nr:hypothetical protein [Propionibacteriaceae bacterium]
MQYSKLPEKTRVLRVKDQDSYLVLLTSWTADLVPRLTEGIELLVACARALEEQRVKVTS